MSLSLDQAAARATVEWLRERARIRLDGLTDAENALRVDALLRVIDDMEAEAGIGGSMNAQWRLLDRRLRELWSAIRAELPKFLRKRL